MAEASSNPEAATREGLYMERVFDAPVDLVWRAWTDPEHAKKWWGPADYTCPFAEIDLRVGGKSKMCMQDADGNKIWSVGTYKEIVPLKRIVTTDSFSDADGNIVPASHYGMEIDLPLEMMLTITFEDLGGGKTKMTLNHVGLGEMESGANEGWSQSFDKLAASLAA